MNNLKDLALLSHILTYIKPNTIISMEEIEKAKVSVNSAYEKVKERNKKVSSKITEKRKLDKDYAKSYMQKYKDLGI